MSLPGAPAGAVTTCPNCQIGWLVQDDATTLDREGTSHYHCESPAGGCGFSFRSPAYFPPGRPGPMSPPRHAERRRPGGVSIAGTPNGIPSRRRAGGVPNTWQAGEIFERAWVWYDDFRYDHSADYLTMGDPTQGPPNLAPYIDPSVGLKVNTGDIPYTGYFNGGHGFQPASLDRLASARVTFDATVRGKVGEPDGPGLIYMGVYFAAYGNRWCGLWTPGDFGMGPPRAELDTSLTGDPNVYHDLPWSDFHNGDSVQVVITNEPTLQTVKVAVNGALLVDDSAESSDDGEWFPILTQIDTLGGIDLRSIKVEKL